MEFRLSENRTKQKKLQLGISWKPKKLHNFELQIGQIGTSWDELGTKEITEF